MALTEAGREAVYLRAFLSELGLGNLCEGATTIYCDSQGAQSLMRNPVHHSRTKHIDIRHHYIRELYKKGVVNVRYISTTDMPADVMTKALGSTSHERCVDGLGMIRNE